MSQGVHIPVPKDTRAFICAHCGAVALHAGDVCQVMGQGKKADWCGIKGVKPPSFCEKKVHTERWQCDNCGQTAVNPMLLCKPKKLASEG